MSIDKQSLNQIRLSVIGLVRIETPDAEPIKLPRRAYQVLAALALAPEHKMLRTDVTEIVWPQSDAKSRDVLLHQSRRSILDAFPSSIPVPPVVFINRVISLDVTYLTLDIDQARDLAKISIENDLPHQVLQASVKFEQLAGSAALIANFPDTFDAERNAFNALRQDVYRAGWQAAVALGEDTTATLFEKRLHETGDIAPLSTTTRKFSNIEPTFTIPVQENALPRPKIETKRSSLPASKIILLAVALLAIGVIAATVMIRSNRGGTSHKQSQRAYFTYSNNASGCTQATVVKSLKNGDIAVMASVTPSGGAVKHIVHKVSKVGKLLWSTPFELSGFDDPKGLTITVDTLGNVFALGKVFVSQSGLLNITPGWYPVILRINSEGMISRGVVVPYPYRGDGTDYQSAPDNAGGVWVTMHISHGTRGPSTALCHISKDASISGLTVIPNANTRITKLFSTLDGFVVALGSNMNARGATKTGTFVTKYGDGGRTVWSTPVDGTLDASVAAIQNNSDSLALVTKQTVSNNSKTPAIKSKLFNINLISGKIIKSIPLENSMVDQTYYLTASANTNDYVIASTENSPGGSNNIGFIFANSASNEASLKISANIANTSRINGISYLSSAGSRTFRALVNVTMSGKNNQKATMYVHKDRARDIEMSSLSGLGDVLPTNVDKGIAAINIGNTFQLMRLGDIR